MDLIFTGAVPLPTRATFWARISLAKIDVFLLKSLARVYYFTKIPKNWCLLVWVSQTPTRTRTQTQTRTTFTTHKHKEHTQYTHHTHTTPQTHTYTTAIIVGETKPVLDCWHANQSSPSPSEALQYAAAYSGWGLDIDVGHSVNRLKWLRLICVDIRVLLRPGVSAAVLVVSLHRCGRCSNSKA